MQIGKFVPCLQIYQQLKDMPAQFQEKIHKRPTY